MSIPIDRLVHYISDLAQEIHNDLVVVCYFYPHGSKKINNLVHLREPSEYENFLCPELYCNDQEPLNYNLYKHVDRRAPGQPTVEVLELLKQKNITFPTFNFRGYITSIWDHALLLHSEKRSTDVDQYQASQFIPVYYWSHAVIALDWFRYAEHHQQQKQIKKTFLIYNRAWSGTREYRLAFIDLLIDAGLENYCQTTVNPIEPELKIHYNQYQFTNLSWRPVNILENYFSKNDAPSHYSADFNAKDYEATDIEVILETLFDDNRLHLTEKSLRPIACGQPFILTGTHGSLEYLRSYGFKTYGDIWNEGYDQIEDSSGRLSAIVDLMKQIAGWTPEERDWKMSQAQEVAKYNQQHFFSNKFFNQITTELKTNLTLAFEKLEATNTSKYLLERWELWKSDPDLAQFGNQRSPEIRERILKRSQEYNMRSLNSVNK
jgi:hypothetical protein